MMVTRNASSLAGAGLSLARDVHADECPRQRLRLDRSAALEASVLEAARERFRKMEIGERNVREMRV